MDSCGVPGCVVRGDLHSVDEHEVKRTIILPYELDQAIQARAVALGTTYYAVAKSLLHSAFYGKPRERWLSADG